MQFKASTPKHPKDDVRDRCWKLEIRAQCEEEAELLSGMYLSMNYEARSLWTHVVDLTRKVYKDIGWPIKSEWLKEQIDDGIKKI